jgi:hypothetical protein
LAGGQQQRQVAALVTIEFECMVDNEQKSKKGDNAPKIRRVDNGPKNRKQCFDEQ